MLTKILYPIPPRARRCAYCQKPLLNGHRYLSHLYEQEDKLSRMDLCTECHEKREEEPFVSWKGTVKREEKQSPTKNELLAKLKEALECGEAERSAALAALLARVGLLKPIKGDLYEVVATGEQLSIPKVAVTAELVIEMQKAFLTC